MKTAIIIPSKNEKDYLPLLLNSIEEQTYKNYIVIVADAFSTDNTREIVKNYGHILIDGGMPSEARNYGAIEAVKQNCDLLMFIDADIVMPNSKFLEKAVKEFKKRNLDVAGTFQKPFVVSDNGIKHSSNLSYNAIYSVANMSMKMLQWTKKPMFHVCMLATPEAHALIGGFKAVEYGEDSLYATEAAQLGLKFRMLKTVKKVWISPRRFKEKGLVQSGTVYFLYNTLMGRRFAYGESSRSYF